MCKISEEKHKKKNFLQWKKKVKFNKKKILKIQQETAAVAVRWYQNNYLSHFTSFANSQRGRFVVEISFIAFSNEKEDAAQCLEFRDSDSKFRLSNSLRVCLCEGGRVWNGATDVEKEIKAKKEKWLIPKCKRFYFTFTRFRPNVGLIAIIRFRCGILWHIHDDSGTCN